MSIRFDGLKELGKKLSDIKNMDAAKKIVRVNTQELHNKMTRNAGKFKGHWQGKKFVKPTGATKRSIKMTLGDGLRGEVEPHTDYASYVEYGTRKMAAQPFVKPAFNEQKEKFKEDLRRLVE